MGNLKGIITHVQRMSFHDGAGIRDTIFFKGCNLRCKWCHNPETLSLRPEVGWYKERCVHCGECIDKCRQKALSFIDDKVLRNSELCVLCNACVDNCCSNAHYSIGTSYSVTELVDLMGQERRVFEISGGGVTISGGEPTLQHLFLEELVKSLHHKKFHITLQTNMFAPWEVYERILPYVDYYMCDLKLYTTEKHRFWTGKDNYTILHNIQKLDKMQKNYCVRTPVIPGVNDDEDELWLIAKYVNCLQHVQSYELLPYHRFATYKYNSLGMDYDFENVLELSEERMQNLKNKFEKWS